MVEIDRCPDPVILGRRQISPYFTQQSMILEAGSHSVLVVRFGRARNIPTAHTGFSQQEITFPRTEIDTFLSTHTVLFGYRRIVIILSGQFGSQTTFHIPFACYPCPPSIFRVNCQHRLRIIIRIKQGDRLHLARRPDIIGINHAIVPSYYTKQFRRTRIDILRNAVEIESGARIVCRQRKMLIQIHPHVSMRVLQMHLQRIG